MPAPTGLIQQLDQFLHKRELLPPHSRLLVACSGGADSVALLHLLHRVNQSRFWQWQLVVGHVNHGLRGVASQEDETFVRSVAKSLGLPLEVRRLRWRKSQNMEKSRKRGLMDKPLHKGGLQISENAARAARLKALESMAQRRRCMLVVLAHHADDQAETVLLRLLRGAGSGGLAAIRPRRQQGRIHLVRPLLSWPRAALRQWLCGEKMMWREDESNNSPQFLRNRVRAELLPLLETYQPAIRQVLVRLAARQRRVHQLIAGESRTLLRRAVLRKGTHEWHLDSGALLAVPQIVASLALQRAIVAVGGRRDGVSSERLAELLEKMGDNPHPVRAQFAGPVEIELRHGLIRVYAVRTARLSRKTSDLKKGSEPLYSSSKKNSASPVISRRVVRRGGADE